MVAPLASPLEVAAGVALFHDEPIDLERTPEEHEFRRWTELKAVMRARGLHGLASALSSLTTATLASC